MPEAEHTIKKNIQISVVVPTYNREVAIKECIDSLIAQEFPKDRYEIIIVDSSPTDSVKKIIEQSYKIPDPEIKYFHQKKEGPSAARNLGIDKAAGDVIYFFDDDCIADKNCLQIINSAYDRKEIGGVEGKIAGYYSTTVVQKYGDYLFLKTNVQPGGLLPGTDGPITCNASYRKDVLKAVEGFDTQFITMEDLDIALRIRKRGFVFKYMPSAVVYHKHRTSLKEVLKRAYYFCFTGMKLCCDKYPELYSVKKLIFTNGVRIIYKIVSYPYVILTVFQAEDKKFHLGKPLLDILVSMCRIAGLAAAVLYGKKYVNNDSNS
jgi:glycosyltransferase involved in cell wall biosynthesis